MGNAVYESDQASVVALRDAIAGDIRDRAKWMARCLRNKEERYKRFNTKKALYDGAPNLAEPVIDDVIRELKQSIVTTLWQAPRLAQFFGLDDAAIKDADIAEGAFDFHLRLQGHTRRRIALAVDWMLMYGSSVAQVVTEAGTDGLRVPDFRVLSPIDVIVPTTTSDIATASRVVNAFRLTKQEFRRASGLNGWAGNAVVALVERWEKNAAMECSDGIGQRGAYRSEALASEASLIELWEVYHESDGVRRVMVICPAHPGLILYDRPWVYARLSASDSDVPLRPWPFVQFRAEDSDGFYNARGIPELLEVDQKEASTYRTARAISIDFAGKPFVDGPRRTKPFDFKAGSNLDGMEIKWAKPPDSSHMYQQEYARSLAMKRVGSVQGAVSSVMAGDARKTATEVRALTQAANGMSIDAVDRFAEPWGDLFGMMWRDIARYALEDGGASGLLRAGNIPPAVFGRRYAVAAGVSGRIVTQTNTLTSLTNMGQLGGLMDNMTANLGGVAVREFYEWVLGVLDADMARRVMAQAQASPGGVAHEGAG